MVRCFKQERGQKRVSINGNTKLMQHRFLKSLVLQLDRIGHSEKKDKGRLH